MSNNYNVPPYREEEIEWNDGPEELSFKVYIRDCDYVSDGKYYLYNKEGVTTVFVFDKDLKLKPLQVVSSEYLFHCVVGDYIAEKEFGIITIDEIVGIDSDGELLEVRTIYDSSLGDRNAMTRDILSILAQVEKA